MAQDQSQIASRVRWQYLALTSLWTLLLLWGHILPALLWATLLALSVLLLLATAFRIQSHILKAMMSQASSQQQSPSGVVTALPAFGSTTTTSGGVAGDLAGSIATDGAISITAGGSGTSAIGQVIQELSIK